MDSNRNFRPVVRYSEAFKIQIVREWETGQINLDQIRRKYGIGGCHTIRRWVSRYGNGSLGKGIRVEKPQEINERAELKRRVRALERALADANIDLALERACTRAISTACHRRFEDVEVVISHNDPRYDLRLPVR
jgi:transposase-like protein